jgi:non-specific serine/threonine protein kinase
MVDHDSAGVARYRLLETVRAYALRRLDAGAETATIRSRHLAYYTQLAEQCEPSFWQGRQVTWLDQLEVELDNVRAALSWSQDAGADPNLGVRLVAAVARFWDMRGHVSEGRVQIARVVDHTPDRSSARRVALLEAGHLAILQDDLTDAMLCFRDSLKVAELLGDKIGICEARLGQAMVLINQHALDDAAQALDLADHVAADTRVPRLVANARMIRGLLSLSQAQADRAQALLQDSLATFREQNDRWFTAHSLSLLGMVYLVQRAYDAAWAYLTEGLVLRLELRDLLTVARSFKLLGLTAARRGQSNLVALLFGAADQLEQVTGSPWPRMFQAEYEQAIANVRARLGDGAFAQAWAEGRRLPAEELANSILSTDGPQGRRRSGVGPQPILSAREQEVAILIARGYTNRQIADLLIVAPRTVDTHVERILRKLQVHSRVQVTAWVTELGLLVGNT